MVATLRARFQAAWIAEHPTHRIAYRNHAFDPDDDLAFVVFSITSSTNPETIHAGSYTHRHFLQMVAEIHVKAGQGVGLHARLRDTISDGWIEWSKPPGYHFFPTSAPIEIGDADRFPGYHRADVVTRLEYDEQGETYVASAIQISDTVTGTHAAGVAVYLDSGGTWGAASSDDEMKVGMGLSLGPVNATEFRVLYLGRGEIASHGLGSAGQRLYLGTSGGLVTSPPASPAFSQLMAVVEDADHLIAQPSTPEPQ